MSFDLSIPTLLGIFPITIAPGSSAVFVGANGGGKTRLAVLIEEALGVRAHRISAHRSLTLNPAIHKVSEAIALAGLRTGNAAENAQVGHRIGSRWQGKMAVALLNDFDFLIQALFADQANKSLVTHKNARIGNHSTPPSTKFELLVDMWQRLLPHRQLHISGDDILVNATGSSESYKSSEMSDGERAIFYMIGQTLAAATESLLIIDEPELHVHRSIMSKLWDELESARPDCGFVFITHGLEFAANRTAQKFVIREFTHSPTAWNIEAVPEDTGFSEEITTLILGSRRPILFIEGDKNSIDLAIYRCCYPDWTVIPRASCEEVIHSVVTMRRNQSLTRVTCSGIIDADHHSEEDAAFFLSLGVATLPVSEIENIVLLPAVSRAIAQSDGHDGSELIVRLDKLKAAIFATLSSDIAKDAVATRYCRRRIDRLLKKIDLSSADNIADITAEYQRQTNSIPISQIGQQLKDRLSSALETEDLHLLLASYDNKGLLALAAQHLKSMKRKDFESWLIRILRSDKAPALINAFKRHLPLIQPQ